MRSKQPLRMIVLAIIAGLILAGSAGAQPRATADFVDQVTAVQAALAWVRTQQKGDGSFQPAFGSTTGATIDVLFAVTAAGSDPATWSVADGPSMIDYLADQASAYAAESTAASAKLTLAAIAAEQNPSDFGGIDLPGRLAAVYDEGTGLYGAGLSDHSWALMALGALGQAVPEAAVDWLAAQQLADGSFDAWGWGSDTDTTSLAVEAAVAGGAPITCTLVISAVNYLESQQSPTGGFPSSNAWGPASNANSTAYSMQALLTAGENPVGARWTVGGQTPLDDLLSFQLPGGALEWQSGNGESLLATVQAVTALTGRPLPLKGRRVAVLDGLGWLRAQQADDGGFGPAGWTAQAVLAISSAGQEPSTWAAASGRSPVAYLAANLGEFQTAGSVGRAIQAVAASGANPYSFGGRNLIQWVMSFYDPATGQFDEASNVWEHSLATMGLQAACRPVPAEAVAWLKAQQNADGGWGWAAGSDSDTNSTALAMQSLAASGEPAGSACVLEAVAFLVNQQNGDGGFQWVKPNPYGPDQSDSSSTAGVVQALLATGEEPGDTDWTKTFTQTAATSIAWNTPYDSLLGFQTDEGAFEWQEGTGADLLSTVQAIPALRGITFPQRGEHLRATEDALDWLALQQQPDGSFPAAFGHNAGVTCDVVFALASAGRSPNDWVVAGGPSVMDYLESVASEYATTGANTGKLTLAAICGGRNPEEFGGLDLLAQLQASYDDGTGMYGSGLSDHMWTLVAMKALHQPLSAPARDWLASQQQGEGGFDASGWGTDTDTTALAIEALVATGEPPTSDVIVDALGYLQSQQSPTGGFPSTNVWGPASNANSTAYVIQSLVAVRENPLAVRWTVDGATPMDDLLSFQAASGAFEWQTGSGEGVMATAQAIPALMGNQLPVCSRMSRTYMPLCWRQSDNR